jgi:carboxylate-amine ligase
MSTSYDPAIFHPDDPWTVGVELEVRLVDAQSFKPANRSPYLFEHLPDELSLNIHKELLQSMIEIVTPVCRSADEAAEFIMNALHTLKDIGATEGIELAALATHPFEKKEDSKRFHDPRYDRLANELQIVLKNFLISGLHIHIALPDERAAINGYNASIKYLPLFLALSANSPFALGEDTGLQSYRSKIFQRLPRAGIPEYFGTYREYCELIDQLHDSGMIETIKDVWWDVRLHQIFGTIELRVCDAFYDRERLRLIALLFQALMIYASKRPFGREFHQISRQNKWNAIRHGLKGDFIDGSDKMTMREKIFELIDTFEDDGIFEKISAPDDAEALRKLVAQETIARKLRRIYDQTGDFAAVIEEEIIK